MGNVERSHLQTRELIPWYVNGTLDEREMDQVSGHLAECVSCAQAVDQEVALARRMRADPPGLLELLDMEASAHRTFQESLRRPSRQRDRWRWPAVAATVIVVAATSFFVGRSSLEPTYELMTRKDPHHGQVLQLIFHAQTSEQDIRHLLADSGGALLGNPSLKGVYRIALPPDIDAREYALRLQRHPAVRWVDLELP